MINSVRMQFIVLADKDVSWRLLISWFPKSVR